MGGRGVTRNLGQLSWQEVAFWQNEETSLFCAAKGILRNATAATGWREGKREEGSRNLNLRISDRRRFQDRVCNAPTNTNTNTDIVNKNTKYWRRGSNLTLRNSDWCIFSDTVLPLLF